MRYIIIAWLVVCGFGFCTFKIGEERGYKKAKEEWETVEAWFGKGEYLTVFSDGARSMVSDKWVYFRTADEKIYPIASVDSIISKSAE